MTGRNALGPTHAALRVLIVGAAAALAALPARSLDSAGAEKAREFTQQARAAYAAKDFKTFRDLSRKALSEEPEDPRYLFNAACGEALAGTPLEAARLVTILLDRKIDFSFAADPTFAAIIGSDAFRGVREKLAAIDSSPVGRAEIAFQLPERDLLTEGIAHDPATGDFFVSSVHRRKILRRRPDGAISDFAREGQDGLWSVYALRVDSPRRVLWAATAAGREMTAWKAGLEGMTGLFQYDLKTGRLLHKYLLPAGKGRRVLNDLTLDPQGIPYATDSVGSGVYRVVDGGELEEFIAPGVFRSPQGLAFSPDGKRLYVAEYASGIFAVDVASRRRAPISAPTGAFLLGIDGLVLDRGSLVVTQNLARPHRVSRLSLNAAGDRIERVETLLMSDPRVKEPTLGTVVGRDFYFIANSQWELFEVNPSPPQGTLSFPIVLRINLGG